MVAIKSHQSASFLKSPDARITALLFYGTDAGLVSERARQTAEAWAKRENPPGEILRVDEADLEAELRVLVGTDDTSISSDRTNDNPNANQYVDGTDLPQVPVTPVLPVAPQGSISDDINASNNHTLHERQSQQRQLLSA